MENCIWSADSIVELVKALSWPLVVLILGFSLRSKLMKNLGHFLSKNSVKELSAGTSGVSAKFEALQQTTESAETGSSKNLALPENVSIEAIRSRHEEYKTEYSEEILVSIKSHIRSLGSSDAESIDILSTEISLLQAALKYFDINKVLFRSQYEMLREARSNENILNEELIRKTFKSASSHSGEILAEWDEVRYLSYLVSSGLLSRVTGGYELTKLANSYVIFMERSPQLVDELSKL